MKLIVGLNNPGSRYAKTRHNIGGRVIEVLARKSKAHWKSSQSLKSHWTEVEESGISFVLALPDLFMNESGKAVRALVNHFGIDFKSDLLVVMDDAALPLGKLRLRASGTDGGHRGLRSIEEALGSRDYTRLRVGIAPSRPTEKPLEEYVLSPFEKEEEAKLKEILERAAAACHSWLTDPIEKALDRTNRPVS